MKWYAVVMVYLTAVGFIAVGIARQEMPSFRAAKEMVADHRIASTDIIQSGRWPRLIGPAGSPAQQLIGKYTARNIHNGEPMVVGNNVRAQPDMDVPSGSFSFAVPQAASAVADLEPGQTVDVCWSSDCVTNASVAALDCPPAGTPCAFIVTANLGQESVASKVAGGSTAAAEVRIYPAHRPRPEPTTGGTRNR